LKLSDIDASSGWLYSGNVASTADYVKWDVDGSSTRVDYPYFLPEAGVSVGADYKYVVGVDQGIFVLPQTTYGNPADGAPKDDVDQDGGEFGLEISYTLNGASDQAFVQFADLNEIDDTGVTFENGRQYVLNLSFGSGSGSNPNPDPNDPDSPSIVVGADISFGILGVEDYPETDIVVYPPQPADPNKKYWAASNIYFDSASDNDSNDNTGVLTFAESGTDKEGYQGVYFKWGSLIGVDAVFGAFGSASYLFVPNLADGTYSRVAVSALDGNELYIIGQNWDKSDMDALWNSIAYADVNVIDDSETNNRSDARLTTDQDWTTLAGDYTDYTGDICKFLSRSSSRAATGLTEDWILPTSNNFGPVPTGNQYDADDSVYGKYNVGETTAGDVNGVGGNLFGVKLSYVLNDAPVGFPASGARAMFLLSSPPDVFSDLGYLFLVGGYGHYWSSSVSDGTNAYYLIFSSGYVLPANSFDRTNGRSVRCVRSY
jgi:hypothetical protein